MSEENIAFRLKFLIDNLGITSTQFADKCDIARPTLSQLLNGRNKKISNLIIAQIHAAYPALSVLWLLFGEGDMWATPHTASDTQLGTNISTGYLNENGDSDLANQSDSNETINSTESCCPQQSSNLDPREKNNENQDLRLTGQDGKKEFKQNRVISSPEVPINPNNENINCQIKSENILAQLEMLKEKTRKVVQVTIYYDDSTFQTFYPNN